MTEKLENYGRISSEAYGIWFPEKPEGYEDTAFYGRYIRDHGQPALEVGCGNGRLLIPYLTEGLEVEGLDLSPHMIDICKRRAASKGIEVKVYQQSMQEMDLPGKYSTIYIPYGSFMLVHHSDEVQQALWRFYNHLNPGGRLLISLFDPTVKDVHVSAPPSNEWRLRREGMRADGAIVRCFERARFDVQEQLETAQYRYEVAVAGEIVEAEEEQLTIRWHTQEQFSNLLRSTGFKNVCSLRGYTDEPAVHSDEEFTFVATK